MSRLRALLEPAETVLAVRRRPPLPRVDVATGASVPAWVLRLVVVTLAAGSAVLVVRGQFLWAVAGILLVGTLARPDGVAPSLLAGMAGFALLTADQGSFHPRLFLLVFGLHAMIELGALVGPLPLEAKVEWRALARAGLGVLLVQAVAQPLALLGALVGSQPPAVPWLPLAAASALAVLAWVVAVRLRPDG